MMQDRVSNPGPLTYESGALPIALCGPATSISLFFFQYARNLLSWYTFRLTTCTYICLFDYSNIYTFHLDHLTT